MVINIRTAVIDDCERIRPLQKEIADLHHKGCNSILRELRNDRPYPQNGIQIGGLKNDYT